MSSIQPFKAMHPDPKWFGQMLAGGRLGLLKEILEPRNEHVTESWILRKHREALDMLITNGSYNQSEKPAIYIYEQQTAQGSQFGVWAQTSLQDLEHTIVTHEQTLSEHLERHKSYREEVGLEGSPILLTYRRESQISRLIERAVAKPSDVSYVGPCNVHRLWEVSDKEMIREFQQAFEKISRVYVADGHHRLAAAAAFRELGPQWITSLYISAGQLKCGEFNRVVLPGKRVSKREVLTALEPYFYISDMPGNVPCRPVRQGRLGLCHLGCWYQLDLKAGFAGQERIPDVSLLQLKILEPFFGITDPQNDRRLRSWPGSQWEEMMTAASLYPEAVIFTLSAITADKLIHLAETGTQLPPKSTYTEPKVPFGLLLCCNKTKIYA